LDLATFLSLPVEEVARLVRIAGTRVCGFPINGTRRWLMLEHPPQNKEDFLTAYLETAQTQHITLYKLIFDHGLETLLAPIFGPDILERGGDYMRMAVEGIARLVTHPEFLQFYTDYEVRVRFYGDHRKYFGPTEYAYLSDLFDEIAEQTRTHRRHRLFLGVFAHDASETLAELAIHYHDQCGHAPDKKALIEMYYGEEVSPVDLFIGFDKFCVFDMPLLATGNEDLYFTVSPSLYLHERSLREILFDHLYTRRNSEPNYGTMNADDWAVMRAFYHANRGSTLGVGAKHKNGGYWYPLPQVKVPPEFDDAP
jgi:tuberculosinol/isotuberculosinol synthase